MRKILILGLIGPLLITVGCGHNPPLFVKTGHDSILDRDGGVVLMVDNCIRHDVFGEDYYSAIKESKSSGNQLLERVKGFLLYNGIPVRTATMPFVCGALTNPENKPQKVADAFNAEVREEPQPYGIKDELKNDPEYIKALTIFSSYAFQQPILKKKEAELDSSSNGDVVEVIKPIFTQDQFQDALKLIQSKLQASTLLYVGARGVSESSGEQSADTSGSVMLRTLGALVTGVIFYGPSTPNSSTISAALVELNSKKLSWSNTIQSIGDPANPDALANYAALDPLLAALVRVKSDKWIMPGNPPEKILSAGVE